MPTLKELAQLGKEALLAFVAQLLTDLAALKTRVEAPVAENPALKAPPHPSERASRPQPAPFPRGGRRAQPKRRGRKRGRGSFPSRTLPRPAQWTAPPIDVRLPEPVCPCCGEPM